MEDCLTFRDLRECLKYFYGNSNLVLGGGVEFVIREDLRFGGMGIVEYGIILGWRWSIGFNGIVLYDNK